MAKTPRTEPLESQTPSAPKAGAERPAQPRQTLDILLILDCERVLNTGVQRALAGLHRLLPVKNSRLHLLYIKNEKQEAQKLEALLEQVQAEFQKFDWNLAEVRLQTLSHEMLNSLIREVREAGYDLVVLCSPEVSASGQSAFSHFAKYLVAHVPVSVLLWRKPLSEQPHAMKVLFGVDGSEASLTAVSKAPRLLHLKYAQLQLATVLSPIFQENAVTAPFVNPDVLEQALEANARIVFEMVTGLLKSEGLPKPTCKRLSGSPATELGYYAEIEAPDLIVVGSHNRKGLLAWLMGSVSSQLLQWDKHNLLVVR
jgi:nucleotide-binding universal stress UspA family protein